MLNSISWEQKPILIIRRHPIIFLFLWVLWVLLFWTFILLISFQASIISFIGEKIFYWGISIFIIISILIFLIFWIESELDMAIIYPKSITFIRQISFLKREVTEIPLEHIQEIKSEISWILPTLFWYGKIHILTANNQSKLILPFVKNPNEYIENINTIIKNSI